MEIRLKKFRSVYTISVFFLTFFGGRFYITDEFFHFVKVRQQKVRINGKYKWKTIKIE